jgi:hypothetical protein
MIKGKGIWCIVFLYWVILFSAVAYATPGDSAVVLYEVPKDIQICPVCHSRNFIVIQNTTNGLVEVHCANPSHHPYFLVMAAGLDAKQAIENWNQRRCGTTCHELGIDRQ